MAREFGTYTAERAGGRTRHRLTFWVDGVRHRFSGEPTPHGRRRNFKTAEQALQVLAEIRAAVAIGKTPLQAISPYLDRTAPENQIATWLGRWLEVKRDQAASGARSPTYLRELERYAAEGGHFGFWKGWAIWEVMPGALEDWDQVLVKRDLAAKTRRNVLGAFRSFLGWLKWRGEITSVPPFPVIPVDPHTPVLISRELQDRILEAIPHERRGAFLALARLGRRVSEVRATDLGDYRDGWLMIDKAMKGPNSNAPTRGPKNRRLVRIPLREIAPDLDAWIAWRTDQVPAEQKLAGGMPMFPNPSARNPGKRWIWNAMREEWRRACESIGVDVPLQEGTKHSRATALLEAGAELVAVQALLGHADSRSTLRYAQMTGAAMIQGLRPKAAPVLPQPGSDREKE